MEPKEFSIGMGILFLIVIGFLTYDRFQTQDHAERVAAAYRKADEQSRVPCAWGSGGCRVYTRDDGVMCIEQLRTGQTNCGEYPE